MIQSRLKIFGRTAVRVFIGAFVLLPLLAWAGFQPTTPLPQALLGHTAVIWDGRIYVAGGVSDTGGPYGEGGYLNNVYYCAEIHSDGTLGEWQVAASLPDFLGLGMHSSVVHDGVIYVLGGTNIWGPRDEIYYSSVDSNGALGDWQVTTALPVGLMAQAAAVYNGKIYVLGGIASTVGITDQAYWAEIQPDHSIGAWNTAASLPKKLFGHRAVVVGATLFVIGGTESGSLYYSGGPNPNVSQTVYSAAINADGTLEEWTEQPSLPTGLTFHSAAASGANIYIAGGYDGSGITNAVYFAPVGEGGSLGTWESLDVLPEGLLTAASMAHNDEYLYVLGGGTTYIDEPQDSVYYMPLVTALRASVSILPRVLNKHSMGKWITGIIEVPGVRAKDIDVKSVHISAVNGNPIDPIYADKKHASCHGFFFGRMRKLMVKFDRKAVQDVVPEGEITLRIEGSLKDGRQFSGENTNWIIQVLKKNIKFHRAGKRKSPEGAQVDLPDGSFPGNPELLLTICNQKVLDKLEKIRRKIAREKKKLQEISDPVEFGPHGIKFLTPVIIALTYDPADLGEGVDENRLRVYYWNPEKEEWEALPSWVDKIAHLVRAETTHFSVFQIMAEGASPENAGEEFKLGEVYVFPNPAREGASPTFHVEAGPADSLKIRIYTVSGNLAHEHMITGVPEPCEYAWQGSIPSGTYFYIITAEKDGQKLRKTGKFAVVR